MDLVEGGVGGVGVGEVWSVDAFGVAWGEQGVRAHHWGWVHFPFHAIEVTVGKRYRIGNIV